MAARISICIPIWNEAEWLPGAIESVLAQDYDDWELVIADNASEQDLAAVVARFDDPRIRYHRFERHVDVYESFNRACQLGCFEWIHPISADDRLLPHCLRVLAQRIEAGDGEGRRLAAVIADCERVGPEGDAADRTYFGHQRALPIPDGTYGASDWLDLMAVPSQVPWNLGSIAFAREVMVESGWFRPDVGYGADFELILRVSAYGRISYTGEKLMRYTVRGSSDSLGRSLRVLREGGASTPMGAAWNSALRAHEMFRPIPRRQKDRINDVIARSHIQRALNHRLWPSGLGRRGALVDVWRALRTRPLVFLSPRHLGAGLLAVIAPRSAIRLALRQLTIRRRGAGVVGAPWRA
jgi:glycosyltransferase involved in cell wall biosynthesis